MNKETLEVWTSWAERVVREIATMEKVMRKGIGSDILSPPIITPSSAFPFPQRKDYATDRNVFFSSTTTCFVFPGKIRNRAQVCGFT